MNVRQLLLLAFLFGCVPFVNAQSSFEQGYYIDNAGSKTTCWIRNVGTAESAGKYEYRVDPDGDIAPFSLAKVAEFGIENKLKCIRALIAVDITPERIKREEQASQEPEWDMGHAFLKVLVDGDAAKLYSYFTEGEELFYFQTDSSKILLLRHKVYSLEITPGIVEKKLVDNTYRDQLVNYLPCPERLDPQSLSYSRKALMAYFQVYNECQQASYSHPEYAQHKRGRFSIKLGASFNRMEMSVSEQTAGMSIYFSDEYSPGFSAEAEYILAFNNYKWGLFSELNYYSYFSGYSENSVNDNHDGYVVDYKTIEFPFGVNYYMHLNKNNHLYVRLAFAPHVVLSKSSILLNADEGHGFSNVSRSFVGVGYNYKRLSCEARFYSRQDLTSNLHQRGSEYGQISFRLTYALFQKNGPVL
ncbi:hypothetical protein [Mangrovibacterium sp.]|uniref:hypothetical protein n=1 Tax=Mangrovibacterium sp. TaxID=1961364 RepID=UPI003569E110